MTGFIIVAVILFLVILYVMVKAGCSSSDIGEVSCDYCEAVVEIAESIGGDSSSDG